MNYTYAQNAIEAIYAVHTVGDDDDDDDDDDDVHTEIFPARADQLKVSKVSSTKIVQLCI